MKPFSIICHSCAARLKVAKSTLIGKILACPKCGTMIEIQPPPDWQPVNEPQSPPSADSISPQIGSHFDDIDTVLQSTDTQSPVAKRQSKLDSKTQPSTPENLAEAPNRTSDALRNPLPTPGVRSLTDRHGTPNIPQPESTSEQPILPTDQWLNPAAKNRKRWLTLIAGIGGTAILIIAGIAAVMSRSKTPTLKQAHLDPNLNLATEDIEQSADPANKSPIPTLPDSLPVTDSDVVEIAPATEIEPNLPTTDLTTPPTVELPLSDSNHLDPLPMSTEPPPVLPDAPTLPAKTEQGTDISSDRNSQRNPFNELQPDGFAKLVSPTDSPLTNLDSLQSQIRDLSALLEASGTSLLQIQDLAASEREEQLIGIPKYFVEIPGVEKLDLKRQLSYPCTGLRYPDAKLTTVLNDLILITGVPLTIDTESMLATNDAANPTIKVDIQKVDFNTAIDEIIAPLGLVKTPAAHVGLLLQLPAEGNDSEVIHTLPNFPQKAPAERELAAQELISVIQGLVAPQSWLAGDNPATIELNGDQLVVKNSVLANHQISVFLKKMSAAMVLLNTPTEPTAIQTLIPKWNLIADKLQQPAGLRHMPDSLLINFLEQLRTNTGVTVLVDWNSLHVQSWTPLTKVPGRIDEENLGDALSQLARAMQLTIRAVDSTTIELTTFETAAQQVDLEVYHFGKMLAGKLNEEQALRLITETLGTQLQSVQVRFVYQPPYKTFVVLAPQSLQKQIAAVVAQLEKL